MCLTPRYDSIQEDVFILWFDVLMMIFADAQITVTQIPRAPLAQSALYLRDGFTFHIALLLPIVKCISPPPRARVSRSIRMQDRCDDDADGADENRAIFA